MCHLKEIQMKSNSMIKNWQKFNEELNKSTYMRAAKKAESEDLHGLAKRFKEHGDKFGILPEEQQISFTQKNGFVNTINVTNVTVTGRDFTIEGENQEGKVSRYEGFVTGRAIEIWLSGNYESLPSTRKDANKLINLLGEKGLDTNLVDAKRCTAEDVWIIQ